MSHNNRAPKSGFAAEAQKKVCKWFFLLILFQFIYFVLCGPTPVPHSDSVSVHRYPSLFEFISICCCCCCWWLCDYKNVYFQESYARVPFFGSALVVNGFVCSVCSYVRSIPCTLYTFIYMYFFGITGFHLQIKRQLLSSSFAQERFISLFGCDIHYGMQSGFHC